MPLPLLTTRGDFGLKKIEIEVRKRTEFNQTMDSFTTGNPFDRQSHYSRLSNQHHELLNTSQESLITNLKIKNSKAANLAISDMQHSKVAALDLKQQRRGYNLNKNSDLVMVDQALYLDKYSQQTPRVIDTKAIATHVKGFVQFPSTTQNVLLQTQSSFGNDTKGLKLTMTPKKVKSPKKFDLYSMTMTMNS